MNKTITAAVCISLFIASCGQQKTGIGTAHSEKTQVSHEAVSITTPEEALAELKRGNQRFMEGKTH